MASSDLGAGVAGKLADVVVRSKTAATERLAPHYARVGAQILESFFDLTGGEVKATVAPVWAMVADHPDAPDWLRRTGAFVARGHGQWQTLLAGTATGAAMGGGLGALITNEMNPAILPLIADNPHGVLAPADAAAVTARHIEVPWSPSHEARYTGIDASRFDALVALQSTVMSYVEVLDLLNRGAFTDGSALNAMLRAGWDRDQAALVLRLRRQLLSVQDLAAMANRNIVTDEQGRELAALTGWTGQDFDRFNLLGGEPPDLQSVILAWRRGIITENDVNRAIIQGPIRKEWIPTVKALQWDPLPLTEAADAVNQGHLSMAAATAIAAQNGLQAKDFAVIVDNAGIPPGPQEALDWVNRGLITEGEFRTAFLESRIKNKYIDLYLKSRTAVIPAETVGVMLRRGVITTDRAVALWVEHGYTDQDAADLAANASAAKTASTRDLTQAQVVALYADREITTDEATAMLAALGYDDTEVSWVLDLADLNRFARLSAALISKVRSQYVTRHITAETALTTLDASGINPDQRDDLMTLWNLERDVITKDLTPAQIVAAAKGGNMDPATALDRLVGQGYAPDDARILLLNAKVAIG